MASTRKIRLNNNGEILCLHGDEVLADLSLAFNNEYDPLEEDEIAFLEHMIRVYNQTIDLLDEVRGRGAN